ncbi:hypothetical protein GIB67_019972 [Kingdonia uniflora]|uniref:Uncharacterized protein n=1 Tax=Kingdonia uniflora TaxID=39325 RepID=A0A7J7MKN5_9MAGN|nr:hypothetical protein GIB67_019972 [Kingdonia uniflora]
MSVSAPVVIYPNTVTTQPASHFKSSFRPVYIILAVIVVLTAISCFLGQLCARRFSNPKPRRESDFNHREKDLEYVFKKRNRTVKPVGHGETTEPVPTNNDEIQGKRKPSEDGKIIASA